MIKEAYCSFELAKLLKEKGFPINEHLRIYTNKDNLCLTDVGMMSYLGKEDYVHFEDFFIPTITHQMACEWLREVHKVFIVIDAYHADHWEGYIDSFEIRIYSHASTIIVPNEIAHHTDYTEAVEAALKYSLENLI